jgi:hypothetical protein
MEMKNNHLEVCPEYRRGLLHFDDYVAVNASTSPAERTWFMMKALPYLDPVVHKQHNAIRLDEELDSHATAMFGALKNRVDAVWSEQVGELRVFRSIRCERLLTLARGRSPELYAWTQQLAESVEEVVAAMGVCGMREPTFAPTLVNASVTRQCQLAKSLSTSELPAPDTLNVSMVEFKFAPSEQGQELELGTSGTSMGCLRSRQRQGVESSDEAVAALERRYLCAIEEVSYLSLTSWLLFMFVLGVSNLVSELSVEAISIIWWRFLNNNRVSFIGYCMEDGCIETPDELPRAIKDWSRDARWELAVQFLQASSSVAGVVAVWFVLLS